MHNNNHFTFPRTSTDRACAETEAEILGRHSACPRKIQTRAPPRLWLWLEAKGAYPPFFQGTTLNDQRRADYSMRYSTQN